MSGGIGCILYRIAKKGEEVNAKTPGRKVAKNDAKGFRFD